VGNFVKSDVVVLPYPFSNLKSQKKRPVLVIKNSSLDDLVVVPFTSKIDNESKILYRITDDMIDGGNFTKESSLVLDKIFTISSSLVSYKFGSLKQEICNDIIYRITEWLKSNV